MDAVVGFSGSSGKRWFKRPAYLLIGAGVFLVAVGAGLYYYFARPGTVREKYDSTALYESIANRNTDIQFGSNFDTAQKVEYYISEAWILRSAGHEADALTMLQKAEDLANGGPYPQLYSELGDTYAKQGNEQEAARYYKKALATLEASHLNDKSEYKKQYEAKLQEVE